MRYSYEFKRKAIELFYQGLRAVAIVAGINSGQLYQWVHNTKLWDTMVLRINLKVESRSYSS